MFYIITNIIFVCISFALVLLSNRYRNSSVVATNTGSGLLEKYFLKFEGKTFTPLIENNFHNIVLFLFLITVFTSVFKLGFVPYGLNVDEAGMAYDALSIVNYGVDRYQNPYPVYFINYGDGQNAMYTYLSAFLINFFGYSKVVIRLPAVFLRLLTFLAIYCIMKNEDAEDCHDKTLLFLLLFSICPYFIMQSRWGLESNLLVGFLTISVCTLIFAIRKNSTKLFFASGVFFGLTLYTYALSYIIIPIFLFLTYFYLVLCKKIKVSQTLLFATPLLLLAVPLVLMILVNNRLISEIKGIITIPLLHLYRGGEISLNNLFDNLYIFTMMFSFDNPKYYGRQLLFNAIPFFGTIFYFLIPFCIIGIVSSCKQALKSLKNKKFNIEVIFFIWFLCVLVCQFLISAPNINKSNAIFIPLFYFTANGIMLVGRKAKITLLSIIILLFLNFSLFFHYYFYQYNNAAKDLFLFPTDYIDVVSFSKNLNKKEIRILNNITAQPYIYVLLENQVPPYRFAKNNIKVFNNGDEKTYAFCSAEILQNDLFQSKLYKGTRAYVVLHNEYWDDIFKNYKYKNRVFGKLCVFYE